MAAAFCRYQPIPSFLSPPSLPTAPPIRAARLFVSRPCAALPLLPSARRAEVAASPVRVHGRRARSEEERRSYRMRTSVRWPRRKNRCLALPAFFTWHIDDAHYERRQQHRRVRSCRAPWRGERGNRSSTGGMRARSSPWRGPTARREALWARVLRWSSLRRFLLDPVAAFFREVGTAGLAVIHGITDAPSTKRVEIGIQSNQNTSSDRGKKSMVSSTWTPCLIQSPSPFSYVSQRTSEFAKQDLKIFHIIYYREHWIWLTYLTIKASLPNLVRQDTQHLQAITIAFFLIGILLLFVSVFCPTLPCHRQKLNFRWYSFLSSKSIESSWQFQYDR
jgi:hypothetical protein